MKSVFGSKVFNIVKKIPRGKTFTYKEVAKLAGSPRAYRAVGNILNKSAGWQMGIPCHRVIRSDGRTGGYNNGFAEKIHLLIKDGMVINNGRVALSKQNRRDKCLE